MMSVSLIGGALVAAVPSITCRLRYTFSFPCGRYSNSRQCGSPAVHTPSIRTMLASRMPERSLASARKFFL